MTERVEIQDVHEGDELDIDALAHLIARTRAHDGHRPIGDHVLAELKAGARALPHAAFIVRQDGGIAAYAHLSQRETGTGWPLELFVAPERRGHGLATMLLAHVLDHVASHGGGHIHVWAYVPGPAQERLAARYRMRLIRRLLRMTRPLTPATVEAWRDEPGPEGFTMRTFEAADGPAWLELHNEAFRRHPDAGNWGPEDLTWHLREPWFDPEGFLLASDPAGLAGYCWMKLEERAGWVYFLGVHPRARGTGLAAWLCRSGLVWTAGRGAERGTLYVDEENEPAVALYRGLGFEVHHVDLCFEIHVPPLGGVGQVLS